ncbi:YfiR family protein [Agarivorans sp. 1_MG-2023]|uniref:YfiR family protein n=1 Tax=Agarivorans sp. 1_MG-2023 TaxID=3062634 RepID=UPI0026E3D12C|nr:YfiR family protein [Agarivorans sp. 1_MG-2023]MDO6761938.1 YfiR family protein [Agarivorans sp. 1_MG-2023]
MRLIKRFFKSVGVLLLLQVAAVNAELNDKEAALKAGFLFNFARYSDWQVAATPVGYFKLCSPDSDFLDTASWVLHQQTIHGLGIKVALVELDSLNINQCNLLFVTHRYREQWVTTDKSLLLHTMLVGETPDFIKLGGHIRFFLASGKIRFEVAPESLKKADIVMSSKVLRLSRIVKEGEQ